MTIRRALFIGSKEFGFNILHTLKITEPHVLWRVVTVDDAKDERSVLQKFHDYSLENDLEFSICAGEPDLIEVINSFQPDIAIVCGYYFILGENILSQIPNGFWGIHNSLLPKYRGASPLVWQILNDEKVIGSSLFRFTIGVDDGEIAHQVSCSNEPPLCIGEALDKIGSKWQEELPSVWHKFCSGVIVAERQNEDLATYCSQRTPNDGRIDWACSQTEIDAFIRAQGVPYPGAFFVHKGERVYVIKHHVETKFIFGIPGQVYKRSNDFVTVCCGDGGAINIQFCKVNEQMIKANQIILSISDRL